MEEFNQDRYFRIWARQLLCEFDDICWHYNLELAAPIFEISKSQKTMGAWLPESRTIKISASLITGYSWTVTLNVLKHEIAHQVCSEIFNSRETAHGAAFQHACEMLGVPEGYRRAGGDLPEQVELLAGGTKLSARGRKFIAKVEKLLALARSSNENEAALAMQKANELIERYNLRQLADDEQGNYTYVIINHHKKRIESYQRRISLILRDFFHVKVVSSFLYEPLSDHTHKTIELLGTSENVAIAEYCYYFLEDRLAVLWRRNRHRYGGKTRTEKNSYYLGLLKGFYEKLRQQAENSQAAVEVGLARKDKAGDMRALLKAADSRLDDFVGRRFPRLRTLAHRGPRIYKQTYSDGVEAGREITLHKGVARHDGNLGALLPPG